MNANGDFFNFILCNFWLVIDHIQISRIYTNIYVVKFNYYKLEYL